MTSELDVMTMTLTRPDGEQRTLQVGFDSNGALWIEPRELEIDPDRAYHQLKPHERLLALSPETGQVFIHADTATALLPSPEQRQLWRFIVGKLVQDYQRMRAYESARNN